MEKIKPIKLSISCESGKCDIEISGEETIDLLVEQFANLALFATYHPNSIINGFQSYIDEHTPKERENE